MGKKAGWMLMLIGTGLFCSGTNKANVGMTTTLDQAPINTQPELESILEMARRSTYSYDITKFLSNSIGPRLSGSPQAAAAVTYIAQTMRTLGLDVRLEPVTVRHWVRGKEEAELVRYSGQAEQATQKIIVTALGNSVATPTDGITASVLVADSFKQLEQLPVSEVSGKIVVFNYPFDEFAARAGRWEEAYAAAVEFRNTGPSLAARKGAIAALVRSAGSGAFRVVHTGVTRYSEGNPKIPAGAVSAEDAALISGLAKQGPVRIHLVLTPSDLPMEQSYNVVADLKGSEHPKQIVIVSAHLDSWDLGTGALDDAVGIGIAMDVLRIVQKACPSPNRTIRFIAWMNEENGGAGGRMYAERHSSELKDHVAAIEIDYGDGRPLALSVAGIPQRVAPISGTLHKVGDHLAVLSESQTAPGPI
ncbi:MAG: M20/M25/M40 family metallo-hydrolase [Acidobacteria bacterium]|nr:M20/M25/M40 family metallo-hydrolase [Acidobacteriota bacterium]